MNQTIGFIGGGNIATSLIGGLLNAGTVKAHQVMVFDPSDEKSQMLSDQFKIDIAANNVELVSRSDIVLVAVKPQVLKLVLQPLAQSFKKQQPLIVSVVAGITVKSIEKWLDGQHPIVRVMPNTPALIGVGASGLYANSQVSEKQRNNAEQLLNTVGISAWVNTEADIDSVTALSGSGPAYFMLFIQSLIDAAEQAGLDLETAKKLALQTATGAADLISSSDEPLQTLIDNVTSPGGTTEQALKSFHQSGLPNIVKNAFDAAKQRSQELAAELG